MPAYAVLTTVANQPGILFGLTRVLLEHQANVSTVDINPRDDQSAEIYLEFAADAPIEPIVEDLRQVTGVSGVELTPSFAKIYGKRIIIMGGGAQVGQVALGEMTEGGGHNVRGEWL